MGLSSTNGGYCIGNGSALLCTTQGGDNKHWEYTAYSGYFTMYLFCRGGQFIVVVGAFGTGDCSITRIGNGTDNTCTASISCTYHAATSTTGEYAVYKITYSTASGGYGLWPAILLGNHRDNLIVGVRGYN